METKSVSIGGCLLLCVVATVYAASCPYNVKVTKAAPCKNNKNPIATLSKIPAVTFVGDCRIKIDGCAHFNEGVKVMNASIKASKNGIPMITLVKEACGFKDGKFEIKCPMNKNFDLCPGENTFAVPGGPKVVDMLLGKVGAKVDLITDKGTFCYEGEATISKS